MFIAQNIEILLKHFNLSIAQLSRDTGISRIKLIRMHQGQKLRFRINDIIILSNYFNVSINNFVLVDLSKRNILSKRNLEKSDFDYIRQFSENFIYLIDNSSLYKLEKSLPISRMTLNRIVRKTKTNFELQTVLTICNYYHLSLDDILKKDLRLKQHKVKRGSNNH